MKQVINGVKMKKFDEFLSSMEMSNDEKSIVTHLFPETAIQDLRLFRENSDLCICYDDRIWFDPESGTGISPEILIRYLRNEEARNGYENTQMLECSWHIACLPLELRNKVSKIRSKLNLDYELKEGF